jgi:hypothetical protein
MSASAAPIAPGRNRVLQRLRGVGDKATTTMQRPKTLLLTRREAAASLGMSLSHFQRHVQPRIRCVYSGQLRLYRPLELERWIEREVEQSGRG